MRSSRPTASSRAFPPRGAEVTPQFPRRSLRRVPRSPRRTRGRASGQRGGGPRRRHPPRSPDGMRSRIVWAPGSNLAGAPASGSLCRMKPFLAASVRVAVLACLVFASSVTACGPTGGTMDSSVTSPSFLCADTTCSVASQVCAINYPAHGGTPVASCSAAPASCSGVAACPCANDVFAPPCQGDAGSVRCTEQPDGGIIVYCTRN